MNLETAPGRAPVGRDAVRWRGALTLEVKVVVGTNLGLHEVLPVEESGQRPFRG